jgi:hypothetical protein
MKTECTPSEKIFYCGGYAEVIAKMSLMQIYVTGSNKESDFTKGLLTRRLRSDIQIMAVTFMHAELGI